MGNATIGGAVIFLGLSNVVLFCALLVALGCKCRCRWLCLRSTEEPLDIVSASSPLEEPLLANDESEQDAEAIIEEADAAIEEASQDQEQQTPQAVTVFV